MNKWNTADNIDHCILYSAFDLALLETAHMAYSIELMKWLKLNKENKTFKSNT